MILTQQLQIFTKIIYSDQVNDQHNAKTKTLLELDTKAAIEHIIRREIYQNRSYFWQSNIDIGNEIEFRIRCDKRIKPTDDKTEYVKVGAYANGRYIEQIKLYGWLESEDQTN